MSGFDFRYAPVSFVHASSMADFITVIVGFEFSVHTSPDLPDRSPATNEEGAEAVATGDTPYDASAQRERRESRPSACSAAGSRRLRFRRKHILRGADSVRILEGPIEPAFSKAKPFYGRNLNGGFWTREVENARSFNRGLTDTLSASLLKVAYPPGRFVTAPSDRQQRAPRRLRRPRTRPAHRCRALHRRSEQRSGIRR
jgi:hypothetical protein